jgi:hypothetical protein
MDKRQKVTTFSILFILIRKMSQREEEEEEKRWKEIVDRFVYCEYCWATEPNKWMLTSSNVEIIELWFRVLRRFLDTKRDTEINRSKFFDKIELLSFLLGFAQEQMGVPISLL